VQSNATKLQEFTVTPNILNTEKLFRIFAYSKFSKINKSYSRTFKRLKTLNVQLLNPSTFKHFQETGGTLPLIWYMIAWTIQLITVIIITTGQRILDDRPQCKGRFLTGETLV